ncbi:MAG: Crp/Fnr family transcriptional regulator [Bradymonadales bacterium]|jgi:CRP-like cAMP-binding protein
MDKHLKTIIDTPLFRGMQIKDVLVALRCLCASTKSFAKGQNIISTGDKISWVGIILEGFAFIEQIDYWGNRHIISELHVGAVFAESLACSALPSSISVRAQSDSLIMILDVLRLLDGRIDCCSYNACMLRQLVSVMALKNRQCIEKTSILSQRSTREKLLTYLSFYARTAQSSSFELPFNRQALADYLGVDRSALSNVLAKLQNEGLLRFEKNRFELFAFKEQ